MQNLLEELKQTLSVDDRLVSEGKLLKNKVVELTLALDPKLLKLLMSNESTKSYFFTSVEDVLVFDKLKFQKFVSNKEFLPDSYTAYKNKIGLTHDDDFIADKKDVVLSWAYKDCILEGGQSKEDVKREEVFWNTTLAPREIDRLLSPKVLVNFKTNNQDKMVEAEELSSGNFIIKGNNLLTLASLKKKYSNKVKLIYIDPPYNKQNDSFLYNDSFNHSTWLTFMKNRLEIAKEMLLNDGVIAISIDHTEAFHLKVLCDEIFNRENFIAGITVQNNPKGRGQDKHFATSHEYLLFYSKSQLSSELTVQKTEDQLKKDYGEKDENGFFRTLELRNTHREFGKFNRRNLWFPLYVDPTDCSVSLEKSRSHSIEVFPHWDDGFEGCWTWGVNKVEIEGELLVGREVKGKWKIYRKSYATDKEGVAVSKKLKTIWFHKDFHTEKGQKALDEILGKGGFRSPKPVSLIKTIVDLATSSDTEDIVMDFFGGSGTTAHAVLEINKEDNGNRKFVLCEQMDYVESITVPRVLHVAQETGGTFIYCELARANELFVKRILDATSSQEIVQIWTDMQETSFMSYKVNPKQIDSTKSDFMDLSLENQKKLLMETLDMNMLYVPLSEINDETYKIGSKDKVLNSNFYKAQ